MRIVSLSHVLDPGTVSLFPGDPPLRLDTVAHIATDGYYLQRIEVGEHTGTHWGAPAHFNAGEACADELDVSDLFLPGVKIDIRGADPDYAVTAADLASWRERHGGLPTECAVLLHTGWDGRWGTDAYVNADAEGVPRHPGFGVDAVRLLFECGALGRRGALGTDAFSPDVGADTGYAVSRMLYREHRISLEVLAGLDQLPARGFHVLVGGAIHRNGSGAPAAVYAIFDEPG